MNKYTLLLISLLYIAGCSKNSSDIKQTLNDAKKRDSMRVAHQKIYSMERNYMLREDTLEIVLMNDVTVQQNTFNPNIAYMLGSTTKDGTLRRLKFVGDYNSDIVRSSLKKGDTLKFLIPKHEWERNDSNATVYDFSQATKDQLDHLLTINGKKFPR